MQRRDISFGYGLNQIHSWLGATPISLSMTKIQDLRRNRNEKLSNSEH
ncbi:MAG: hypothetical protein AAF915_18995 [Cyanobacteria bacterium P01_D01_bin.50]